MVLGVDKLLGLVKGKKLVQGLCERELKNPEGSGFDLCIGKIHEISGRAFMGIEERNSAKSKLICEYKKNKKQSFIFRAGETYLITTREKVNIPEDITACMWLRSTLYRSGIIMSGGNIAPGYCGELSFLFYNAGEVEMEIEMGARIVHIIFWQVEGQSNLYRGQWKGGRVSTVKLEKQI